MKDELKIEKCERILETFKMFFECESIREVSLKTGMSKSSIQRYLHDPLAIELLGSEIVEMALKQLQKNRENGNYKGGVNFLELYEKTRDDFGRFNGVNKKR